MVDVYFIHANLLTNDDKFCAKIYLPAKNNKYEKGNFIVIVNIIMSFLKFIMIRKYNSYINKYIGKKQTQRIYIL